MLRPRYNTYVVISAPNNMHSEARKIHIASLVWGSPVVVSG